MPHKLPNLCLNVRLNNELDRSYLPRVLRQIAIDIEGDTFISGATYPIRNSDGNVIGGWQWGYNRDPDEPTERDDRLARIAAEVSHIEKRAAELEKHCGRVSIALADVNRKVADLTDELAALREDKSGQGDGGRGQT